MPSWTTSPMRAEARPHERLAAAEAAQAARPAEQAARPFATARSSSREGANVSASGMCPHPWITSGRPTAPGTHLHHKRSPYRS